MQPKEEHSRPRTFPSGEPWLPLGMPSLCWPCSSISQGLPPAAAASLQPAEGIWGGSRCSQLTWPLKPTIPTRSGGQALGQWSRKGS